MNVTLLSQISWGDLAVIASVAGSVIYNYYAVVRRVDLLDSRSDALSEKVEDLRRGRGLILEHGDWPAAVRRCFGFDYGHKA